MGKVTWLRGADVTSRHTIIPYSVRRVEKSGTEVTLHLSYLVQHEWKTRGYIHNEERRQI